MKWFYNLTIGTKLLVGFSIVAVIAGLVGGVGMLRMRVMDELADAMYEVNTKPLGSIGAASTLFQRTRVNMRDLILAGDAQEREKYRARIHELDGQLKDKLEEFEKGIKAAEVRKEYDELQANIQAFMPVQTMIVDMAMNGDREGAMVLMHGKGFSLAKEIDTSIQELFDMKISQAEKRAQDASSTFTRAIWVMLGLTLTAVVMAVILGIFITRLISLPLKDLAKQAEKIARGDLNVTIYSRSRDEIGQLSSSFQAMVQNLRSMVGKMSETSATLASAAAQLSAASEQMAAGSEEVAAQAGTVATAGEEMAVTSGEIAKNCTMAAQGANHANESAQNGAEVVEGTVSVMNRIAAQVRESAAGVEGLGSRSEQIGEIVGVIEDIADQTNLLALNAAIEAARAGEQGRGFAVVADEVRALAERTTKATKEIGQMIKAIQHETKGAVSSMVEGVREVEKGTSEAAKSGRALKDILELISAVTMQVSQIATAAEQQTATTTEISSNVHQMTEVVQETARGAHESATSARQVAVIADELQKLVSQFKLTA
jgi:methyl-accepting chemotaxis protein